jgi:hypothetical protein
MLSRQNLMLALAAVTALLVYRMYQKGQNVPAA